MTHTVRGTFDVSMTGQPPYDTGEGAVLARTSMSKQFQGGLEGTSTGEMLSAVSEVKGSAGYVAIERVIGKLQGRSGSFVLQHRGTMKRGVADLMVTVVPDSGMLELKNLAGKLSIDIVEGKHFYTFEYDFDAPP